MDAYNAIAWIPADTRTKHHQAPASTAAKPKRPGVDDGADKAQCVEKLRHWLNKTGKTLLIVFDNLERAHLLDPIWPASDKGSVIVTTRSPADAAARAKHLLHLNCFAGDAGAEVLYSLVGRRPTAEGNGDDEEAGEDAAAAAEVCRLLGGLPLAMVRVDK